MLQSNQPAFTIWEIDVDSNITVAQVSFYLNSNSTEALEVLIKGEEKKRLYVPPGSTTNYIGQGIRSIKIPNQGNEQTYIEGKYVISTTLQLQTNAITDQ
ncbi:hypothetical protein I6N90_08605 [Paenibacillus sp. GSMTC-2017]|nr:S-Ena type endospore appendage [Paenibacillus sp. GSMTC-2017]MBH5317861.1 hypothetical protein [Paenibacillus sp. GSMTC-2017]